MSDMSSGCFVTLLLETNEHSASRAMILCPKFAPRKKPCHAWLFLEGYGPSKKSMKTISFPSQNSKVRENIMQFFLALFLHSKHNKVDVLVCFEHDASFFRRCVSAHDVPSVHYVIFVSMSAKGHRQLMKRLIQKCKF